jgi:hypothetical protein
VSIRALATLGLVLGSGLGLGRAASGLSLTLQGAGVGPISSGIGAGIHASDFEPPDEPLTFLVGLDAQTAINGYDITLAWDPVELSFVNALPVIGLPFSAAPDPSQSGGTRVAAITLTPRVTDALFVVTFDVLTLTRDGLADVSIFVDPIRNGSGISPGSLSLANPGGAGIDMIPEPGSGALLALGLGGLGAARRRSSARRRTDG